ncbi:MAG: hypothetical protein ACK559_32120, partial [bacterium]
VLAARGGACDALDDPGEARRLGDPAHRGLGREVAQFDGDRSGPTEPLDEDHAVAVLAGERSEQSLEGNGRRGHGHLARFDGRLDDAHPDRRFDRRRTRAGSGIAPLVPGAYGGGLHGAARSARATRAATQPGHGGDRQPPRLRARLRRTRCVPPSIRGRHVDHHVPRSGTTRKRLSIHSPRSPSRASASPTVERMSRACTRASSSTLSAGTPTNSTTMP